MQKKVIEGFRASLLQKRLWLLQGDSVTYRAQCALLLEGSLNNEVLREAVQNVVVRYQILRTTFHCLPGMKTPIQVVADDAAISWRELHFSGGTLAEQEHQIDELFEQEKLLPFDIERGPALHCSLIVISDWKRILILSVPSLCGDSKSLSNLVREIADSYSACLKGEQILSAPVQYIQYSEWQNNLVEERGSEGGGPGIDENISALSTLTLPLEHKVAQATRFEPKLISLTFPSNLIDRVRVIVQQYGSSTKAFYLTCWLVLIWRLTGEPDLVVGDLCDGREHEMLRDALGLFARWLPVRGDFQNSTSFDAILSQVDKSLEQPQQLNAHSVWQSSLNSREEVLSFPSIGFEFDQQPASYSAAHLSSSLIRKYACIDRFKAKLSISNKGDCLDGQLHYDSAVIALQQAQKLAAGYQNLVGSVIAGARGDVRRLKILSRSDTEQVLVEFGRGETEHYGGGCIQEVFERQTEQTPKAVAVVCKGERLSYEELNARANRLARFLRKMGIGPEVAVGMCVERSLEMIVGMLGVLKAGGAYVPLDPFYPIRRLVSMLEDLGDPIVLTQKRLVAGITKPWPRTIYVDDDWDLIGKESDENLPNAASVENLAYILFTSGSTGKPKGVAVEHRQLLNYIFAVGERLCLPAGANFATVSTFAADLGNTVIFPSLCTGGCLHIISEETATDPSGLAGYFDQHSIDCLKIVPSHLASLLTPANPQHVIPSKRLILGGEASHWEFVEKLQGLAPDCLIFNHYGPTETTVGVLTYQVKQRRESRMEATVPIGRPIANVQTYILDAQIQPLPIGVAGELHVGGNSLTRGYYGNPEQTAEKFIPNPFSQEPGARMYKTGDLARHLSDGNIEFLGRRDAQVKYHGFRVELSEIASALKRHPEIRNSVVVMAKDNNGDGVLMAYYVSRRELEAGELRAFLSDCIIEETIPSLFVHLRRLPLTLNGKVNFEALPSLDEAKQKARRNFVAPRTPTEETLAAIWADVLGLEKVGVHDNFFELGGHSLVATRVISKLREVFNAEIPLRSLFENPSVSKLSEAIEACITEQTIADLPMARAIPQQSRTINQQLAELERLSDEEMRALLDI